MNDKLRLSIDRSLKQMADEMERESRKRYFEAVSKFRMREARKIIDNSLNRVKKSSNG